MTSSILIALANHVGQSTLFALVVASLTLLLRRNGARVRYCLWLAASLKFLLPFALLTALGAQIPWRLVPVHGLELSLPAPITQLGLPSTAPAVGHAAGSGGLLLLALEALWLLGTMAVAARGFARWKRVQHVLNESAQLDLSFVVPVRSSPIQLEPAVAGILRTVLLLPAGIEQRLTPGQMTAVLAHERCHVAWRDNLAVALHMLVEALFWCHPLVWWLGKRLIEERERACDEQVLADGHPPESYAEGILRVCEHYLESPLACVAGVGGSNLRQRIEAIMSNRLTERLNGIQKLVLTVAASAAIAVPFAAGVFSSRPAYAQPGALSSSESAGVTLAGPVPGQPGNGQLPEALDSPVATLLPADPSSNPPASHEAPAKLPTRAFGKKDKDAHAGADPQLAQRSSAQSKQPPVLEHLAESGVPPVPAKQDAASKTGGDSPSPASSEADSTAPESATPSTGAALPRKVRDSMPQVPLRAVQQGIGGSVTVHFVIDVTGKPRDARVVVATVHGVFDRAALEAVKRWRYEPAMVEGRPAEVEVTTTIRFAPPIG